MPELLQRPCPLHLTSRPQTSRRGHRRHSGAHLCRAAASGAASFPSQPAEDPYQVLGLPRNADSESIQRVYNKKKRENRDNQELLDRIEKAHSTLMMRQFTMRVQGGGKDVAKEIRFADKPQYLPWRPRRYNADKQLTLYVGIGQALLLAWAVLTPMSAGNQPTVASSLMGAVFNSYKLNQIFPTSSSASEEEKKKGLKNIVRGCLLAVMATFAGCFLLYTFPDAIASQLGKQLPYMFYERQTMLLSVGTILANAVMTIFFR